MSPYSHINTCVPQVQISLCSHLLIIFSLPHVLILWWAHVLKFPYPPWPCPQVPTAHVPIFLMSSYLQFILSSCPVPLYSYPNVLMVLCPKVSKTSSQQNLNGCRIHLVHFYVKLRKTAGGTIYGHESSAFLGRMQSSFYLWWCCVEATAVEEERDL